MTLISSQGTLLTSGLLEDFAISLVVKLEKTWSPWMWRAGSGPTQTRRLLPPTPLSQAGDTSHGAPKDISADLSLITLSFPSTTPLNLALESSTTFTMMASNGMILPATIKNLTFAKTLIFSLTTSKLCTMWASGLIRLLLAAHVHEISTDHTKHQKFYIR